MSRHTVGIASIFAFAVLASLSAQEPSVWYWHAVCPGARGMRLTVTLGSRVLERKVFTVCQLTRQAHAGQTDSTITFSFRANRQLVWHDYRSERDTTPAGRQFEVRIWEAGADPGAMILGVAVLDSAGIRMNTVHIATIDRVEVSQPAGGLRVMTEPITRRGRAP